MQVRCQFHLSWLKVCIYLIYAHVKRFHVKQNQRRPHHKVHAFRHAMANLTKARNKFQEHPAQGVLPY